VLACQSFSEDPAGPETKNQESNMSLERAVRAKVNTQSVKKKDP